MNSKCLRTNNVKGAETINHTETLHSTCMSNYFIFFPPQKMADTWLDGGSFKFSLKVCNWPKFKTSFVLFRGEIVIPFSYDECPANESFNPALGTGGCLKMIRLDKHTGKAKWLMVAPHLLEELKPHRKLQKGLAIAGISNGNLRVLDSKYRVITSWSDVEVMTFNEVYALEGNESDSLPALYV
jgi:hypothetical protein